ncbi:MAG: PAS domain-containing protein [Flavobacteriales bacterium]|nr:PAS domain-containing protein [Flavobacteriales bacterium]
MSDDDALDPSVRSLQKTIRGLRGDPAIHSNGLMEQLDRMIGMMPRFPDHFLYVYNYSEGRIVYHQGFDEVLGYAPHEVDIDMLFRLFHPEDAPIVARLTETVVRAMSEIRNPKDLFSLTLTVDYRMRKKNGQYIKVLRQTAVFEVDQASGKVISTFSLCKDISSIKCSNEIGWQIRGMEIGRVDMTVLEKDPSRLRYRPTSREMDILRELMKGKGSKDISATLGISVLTVNTHRRNLLQRTACRNTAELVRHATERGWA